MHLHHYITTAQVIERLRQCQGWTGASAFIAEDATDLAVKCPADLFTTLVIHFCECY